MVHCQVNTIYLSTTMKTPTNLQQAINILTEYEQYNKDTEQTESCVSEAVLETLVAAYSFPSDDNQGILITKFISDYATAHLFTPAQLFQIHAMVKRAIEIMSMTEQEA